MPLDLASQEQEWYNIGELEEIVYLNGHLIPRSQAKLSPFDYGFLYGYGLFETMRAYRGHIFRLREHLARLSQAAEILGLISLTTAYDLEKACQDTIKGNGLSEARLRLTISAGEGEIVPDPSTCSHPTVFIVARSYTPYPPETYQRGFSAVVSSLRRNSQSPLSRMKSTSYLESMIARAEAKAKGADEALLLNEQEFLVEGSTNNLFVVSNGELATPSVASGVLPGITRQAVLELAPSLNIRAREGEIELEDLLAAEEAFLTNSLLEIMPLTRVNGKPLATGKPGPVTEKLRTAYRGLVQRELTNY